MEIRTHKPIKKTGKHAGAWRLRISYRLDGGDPWKQVDRHFRSYSAAIKARPAIESEIKQTHGGFTKGSAMTFDNLAAHALATYYAPATIKKGVKVDGVKSTASINRHLNALKQYFGKKKISAITTGDLRSYRVWRNNLGSRRGKAEGDLGREKFLCRKLAIKHLLNAGLIKASEKCADIPIIAVTAHRDMFAAELAARFDRVFYKPVEMPALTSAIRDLIAA
jgi:hypothetical protein